MTADAELTDLKHPLTVSFTVAGPILDRGDYALFLERKDPGAETYDYDTWTLNAPALHLESIVRRLQSFSESFGLAFKGDAAMQHVLSHDARPGEPYAAVLTRDPVTIAFRLKGDDVEIAVGLHGELGAHIAANRRIEMTLATGRSPRIVRATASSLVDCLACLSAQLLAEDCYEVSKTTGSAQPMILERADETAMYRRYTAQSVVDDFFTLDPRTHGGASTWRLSDLEGFERVEALSTFREAYEAGELINQRILVPFLEHEINVIHLIDPTGDVALSFEAREVGLAFAPRPGAEQFAALGNREMEAIQKVAHHPEIQPWGVVASHADWLSAGGEDLSRSAGFDDVRDMRSGPRL